MSELQDMTMQLAAILGVDLSTNDVVAMSLDVRANKLPTVTVERALLPGTKTGEALRTVTQRYTLHPISEPAALDLDAMEALARVRVADAIDAACRRHSGALAFGFAADRSAAEQRHDYWAMELHNRRPLTTPAESVFGGLIGGGTSSIFAAGAWPYIGAAAVTARATARGHALPTLLQSIAGAFAFTALLGWFGPTALDGAPDGPATTYASYGYTPAALEPGQAELLDAQARAACAGNTGTQAGYIRLPDGGVQCTTKHGRAHRSVITTLSHQTP